MIIKRFGIINLNRSIDKLSFEEFEIDCQGQEASYNEIASFIQKAALEEIDRRLKKEELERE